MKIWEVVKVLGTSAVVAAVAACESTSSSAPPLTPAILRAAAARHVGSDVLAAGRSLLLRRCIECHALPVIAEHSAVEWPGILSRMSARAGLKPAERAALLSYILTVKTS